MKGSDSSGNESDGRDAGEEKKDMGDKGSVSKLAGQSCDQEEDEDAQDEWTAVHYNQSREYRQGKTHTANLARPTSRFMSVTLMQSRISGP